jgi:hypothetical protein
MRKETLAQKETLTQWLKKKKTRVKVLFCIQLTTALLGGTNHAYNVWHDFNLGDHFHVSSHDQTLPPEHPTRANSCNFEEP